MADENQPGENQEENNQFKTEENMTDEEKTQLAEDENFILDFKQEDYSDPAKVEKLEKAVANAKTTIHQKRHYRTKYQEVSKAQGEAKEKLDKENKKELDKKAAAGENENKFKVSSVEIVDFRQDNPEISREVAKEILEHAKIKEITVEEAMKKPIIKSLIKSETTKEEIEDAGVKPKPGGAAGGSMADKDWSTATPEEINAERAKMGGEF